MKGPIAHKFSFDSYEIDRDLKKIKLLYTLYFQNQEPITFTEELEFLGLVYIYTGQKYLNNTVIFC